MASFIFLRQHFSNDLKLTACIRCPYPIPQTRRRALQSSPSLFRVPNNSTGEDLSVVGLTPCRLVNRTVPYRLVNRTVPTGEPYRAVPTGEPYRAVPTGEPYRADW
jgi:hypothetical protein